MRPRLITGLAILVVLLSGCVSRSFTEIDSVAVVDGSFYVREAEDVEAGTEYRFWVLGSVWEQLEAPSAPVLAALEAPRSTHDCHPGDPGVCFSLRGDRLRIAGPSGETVWGISPGRNEFVSRYRAADPVDGLRLEDIAVSGGRVVAAAGIEGVVVGAGGDFELVGVGDAVPTPTTAFGATLTFEILVAACVGLAVAWLWMAQRMNTADPDAFAEVVAPATTWLVVLAAPVVGLSFLLVTASGFGGGRLTESYWQIPVLGLSAAAAVAIGSATRRARRRGGVVAASQPGNVWRFWLLALLTGTAIVAPFLGWTAGAPDAYRTAQVIAAVAGLLVTVTALRLMPRWRFARNATGDPFDSG